MDPFSVTAGVAGLLSLSLQISQILTGYIDSVKNAPKEAKELVAKLTALISVLEQLERFIEKHAGACNFDESSVLYGTTKRCNESLEHLQLTLEKFTSSTSGDSSTWRRILQWPLTKEKHQQTVSILHEYLEIFDLSTSLDGLTLAAKTAEEVRDFGSALSDKMNKVLGSMLDLARSLNYCRDELRSIKDNLSDRARADILHWFSNSVDPSQNYNRAIKNRQSGTGQWFLQTSEFTRWIDIPSFIWLHGIPGSGKTVLCSTVIEAIKSICESSLDRRMAYFYFDFQEIEKKRTEPLLRSIIRQLLAHESEFPEYIVTLYKTLKDKGQSPTLKELESALKCVLETPFRETYIILDALDEFPEWTTVAERREMLAIIVSMVKKHTSRLHVLATSRDEPDIREAFECVSHSSFCLHESAINSDIAQYVKSRIMDPMERLSAFPDKSKTEIECVINQRAHGMFRWAVCQLDVLRQCRKTRDITDTLEQLPTTLDQTYERILAGIDIKDHPELFSILYWLTSSRRPLTLQEMAEAAIIPAPDQTFDPEARLFHFSEVLRICGSLITCSSIDLEGNQTMRFAHYSVQEFLLSGRGNHFTISIANSRNHTMGCCIVYLQYIKTIPDPKPDHLPLLQYVAQYWFEHLKAVENVNSNVVDLAYGLFEDNFPMHAPKWLQIYEPCTASPETHLSLLSSKIRVTLSYPGPLFYAVQHGLFHAVRRLLERGVSVNELHGIELDLDRLFSFSKNPYVYELLLTYLDSGIGYLTTRQTALQLAVQMGNKELVELLLKFSADPNICATPIQRPSHSRSILPNMQLYQRSMNSKSIAVRYPLGDAMRIGYSEIVSLLLAHGAIPDVPIKGYASVIHAAARRGYHEVVSHLILAGADVNVRGLTGEFDNATVLSAACSQPYVDVVRLLIKSGADLDTVDIPYTALQIASWAEHEEIVRTLLETGADPNLVGQAWGIDSYLAGTYGLSKREKLCSNSCDWNMKVTPLAMASILGNRMIVLSLLEAGADKNTEGCIQHAAKAQNWTVVRLLIEAGANVHATAAQQIHLPSLVYSATSTGELDMVRQLLDIGADVTRPYKRQTPLGAAMINGHFQVAELLRAYDPIYTTSRTAYVDIMNRLKARQEQILIGSKIGEEETLLPAISGSNQTCVGDDASVTWL